MPIIVNLDVQLAKNKMQLNELSKITCISVVNLSILKRSKSKAIRFTTLESICKALNCQPGELLEYTGENQ